MRFDGENSSIFSFAATFLRKNENQCRKLGAIEGNALALGKAPGKCLPLFLSISELCMRQEKRFSSLVTGMEPVRRGLHRFLSEVWAARRAVGSPISDLISTSRHLSVPIRGELMAS